MNQQQFTLRVLLVTFLALMLIMFGAYVRLSHAGLGCPDWPLCYGRIIAPLSSSSVSQHDVSSLAASEVSVVKAWKEMGHRYLAVLLGLALIYLSVVAWRNRSNGLPILIPSLLVVVVILQGLLGALTVTLKVHPMVVTSHLFGGLLTLGLLWWLALQLTLSNSGEEPAGVHRFYRWAWLGLVILLLQIFLGAWTSTNYAALVCSGFPSCYGNVWLPPTNFTEAFVLFRDLGENYEYGVLSGEARTAIHITHRLWATFTAAYIGILSIYVWWTATTVAQRNASQLIFFVLAFQFMLGIGNVVMALPLPIAVAHNGGAALLLCATLSLIFTLGKRG